jgi:hypothetical protein
MASRSWARSGTAARAPGRGPRPAGSWAATVARARQSWDELAYPDARLHNGTLYGYSDVAAAAILACAATLWADTAASLGGDEDGDDVG